MLVKYLLLSVMWLSWQVRLNYCVECSIIEDSWNTMHVGIIPGDLHTEEQWNQWFTEQRGRLLRPQPDTFHFTSGAKDHVLLGLYSTYQRLPLDVGGQGAATLIVLRVLQVRQKQKNVSNQYTTNSACVHAYARPAYVISVSSAMVLLHGYQTEPKYFSHFGRQEELMSNSCKVTKNIIYSTSTGWLPLKPVQI